MKKNNVMAQNHTNLKEVFLTTWETNPRKRNKNNVITFVAPKETLIVDNDAIIGMNGGRFKIEEILVQRPAKLTGFTFYKARSFFNV